MSPYASNTEVSTFKSQQEIQGLVSKAKANRFFTGSEDGRAIVGFEMADRRIQFELTLPMKAEFRKDKHGRLRDDHVIERLWEQACRQRWRALTLCIKAKLVSVETGVETFEEAFLAQVVVPGVGAFGKWATRQLDEAYKQRKLPPLLPERSP